MAIRRRRVMILLAVAAVVGAAAVGVWWRPAPVPQPDANPLENRPQQAAENALGKPSETPRPCRAMFERVEKGMTRDQVAATVGGGPGTYAQGQNGRDFVVAGRGLGWTVYDRWVADDGELLVLFGDDGRVSEIHIWDVWRP